MIDVDNDAPPAPMFDGTQPCASVDPDLWFPAKGQSSNVAKAICATCPFREPCLEWGLKYEREGVWGGLSSVQRAQARRARGIEVIDLTPPLVETVNGVGSHTSGPTHGTAGGARWHHRHKVAVCDECRDYERRRQRHRSARPTVTDDDARHGTAAGFYAGCKCDPCRDAANKARRLRGRL